MAEEQEEPSVQPVAWTDRPLAKGANLVFTIIGVIATVVGVVFTIYLFASEPKGDLTATYQEGRFVIPKKLFTISHADTIMASRDTMLVDLLGLLRSKADAADKEKLPETIPYLPSLNSAKDDLYNFASYKRYFYVVSIKNKGDKSANQLQILHRNEVYYEYEDSNGTQKQGQSVNKFSIGDLSATESREVRLWSMSPLQAYHPDGIIITFADGKILPALVAVDGDYELEEKRPWNITGLIQYGFLLLAAYFLYQLLRATFMRR